jgi:hypothetical protein
VFFISSLALGDVATSARTRHLFPTAYESPRIRFTIVDGLSGERFPAWVVRNKRYVFGIKAGMKSAGCFPVVLCMYEGDKNQVR